jgi:hypothetical protein
MLIDESSFMCECVLMVLGRCLFTSPSLSYRSCVRAQSAKQLNSCITCQKGTLPLPGSATPASERFELPASSVCVNFVAVFSCIAYYFTRLGDNIDKVG